MKVFLQCFLWLGTRGLNMLHGLELLIPSSGTGTGNCDTQRKWRHENQQKI